MSTMIVVRNAAGLAVAYGPAGEGYEPSVPAGCTVAIEHDPDLTPTEEAAREAAKQQRTAAVAAIQVTTAAGNTFDGDEVSQSRMVRAIIALGTGLAPSVNWVLADNSVVYATKEELTEALTLAGMAQAALWVIPG